ncbi:MAG: tRNA pseudouridine(55) synthase TruB [Thermoguttaceae bacterium]
MVPYGILNLNKPPAVTSRDVVNQIQRLVRPAKVGHAGTLDPLATGVLVVCVGAATRLIEYVQRMPKGYTGTFLLGRSSPTEDIEGEVTELDNPPVPTREQIVAAAAALVGHIEQRPPIYSALKVDGRRAYALARKGKEVALKPRCITIHRLEVEAYDYPQLTLNIECGSGTYIRSLGRDLAESLSTAAVMSALVRTKIGCFDLKDALDPLRITEQSWPEQVLPASRAVESLPRIELSADEIAEIRNGRMIPRDVGQDDAKEFAAMGANGRLIAILIRRGEGLLGPSRNLP